MKDVRVFVWHDIEKCTREYHSEGSLVVIASDLSRARELVAESEITPRDCDALDSPPSYDWRLADGGEYEETLLVMPNAGCC